MTIIEHLEQIKTFQQTSGGCTWSVFSFYGAYAPSFFDLYVDYLRKCDVGIRVLDVQERDIHEISAQLSISFLGQGSLYWCGDLTALDTAKKKQMYALLKDYTGPHTILAFVDDQQSVGKNSVELPLHVNQGACNQLCSLLFPQITPDNTLISALYKQQDKMLLEQVCQLFRYIPVFDGMPLDIALTWLGRLIYSEQSLFELSQHFFAKERKAFMTCWSSIEKEFPLEFWTAFWSEQLWQASLFVKQAAEVGPSAGRKGVTRLPFSFMQRDWKQYGSRELCAAHNFLYSVDYGSKNGHATYGLDMFIDQWMLGLFAKK